LRRGDLIRIRLADTEDEWADGFVALASDSNPSSVMLWFINGSACVRTRIGGLLFNGLPLTVDYDKETVEGVVTKDLYEIEVKELK
jgi:hypothetical protein